MGYMYTAIYCHLDEKIWEIDDTWWYTMKFGSSMKFPIFRLQTNPHVSNLFQCHIAHHRGILYIHTLTYQEFPCVLPWADTSLVVGVSCQSALPMISHDIPWYRLDAEGCLQISKCVFECFWSIPIPICRIWKATSKTIKTFPPSGSQSGIQLHFRHGNLWQTKWGKFSWLS